MFGKEPDWSFHRRLAAAGRRARPAALALTGSPRPPPLQSAVEVVLAAEIEHRPPCRADAPRGSEAIHRRAARALWALLPARFAEVLSLVYRRRCGEMRITALIADAGAARKSLTDLGEPTSPPRLIPARSPPLREMHDAKADENDPQAHSPPDYEFDRRIARQVPAARQRTGARRAARRAALARRARTRPCDRDSEHFSGTAEADLDPDSAWWALLRSPGCASISRTLLR
ncbi:hypothetical protein [Accumulibacter sp.]|uniref:hypothetical protein n=1 Tax=Accumulibacter sp. TaxID=2053492 RepID=UPI0025F3A92D|nr:hypothetical protein [Accumulibacter sp.]MCM8595015.1 hypothetical protein [Accumulibacter sp.]MDS4049161.1 hypothetical protein [Accumulibacter sp.]